MGFWNKVQSKVDEIESKGNNSLGEIIDEGVKKTFNVLSGAGAKTHRIPDNVISFMSVSGGAGASTVVANVATTLKGRGYSVLVIDVNILYPSQYSLLGYNIESKEINDIVSFMSGRCTIGEAIRNNKDVSLLSANNRTIMDLISVDKMEKVGELGKAIDILRDYFDVILLDIPNQLTLDIVHTCLYLSDMIYLVWDESLDCIINTEVLKKSMLMVGVNYDSKLRIVLNKRTSVQYPRSIIEQSNIELVSVIPFEVSVIESGLAGGAYVKVGASFSPNAKVFIDCMEQIAEKILVDAGANDGAIEQQAKELASENTDEDDNVETSENNGDNEDITDEHNVDGGVN